MIHQILGLVCAILGLCGMAYWAGRLDGRDIERRRKAHEEWKAHKELRIREDRAKVARQKAIRDGHLMELWKVN